MTIAVMVFRMVYVSALAAALLIAAAGLLSPGGTPQAFAQVDTTAPTISSITITSDTGDEDSTWDDDGVYGIGDRIRVTITFSENMTVTGSPRLELDVGGAAKAAEYESAEGSKVVFGYTVIEGDADNDGIAVGENKLTLNAGSIKDAADNTANLFHDALAAQNNHRVDGVRPTISRVALSHSKDGFDDIYVPGETLVASVEFNEDVVVAGSPRLALDFQGTNRLADFERIAPKCESDEGQPLLLCSASAITPGGIRLVFEATVLEGDEDKDGVAITANSLTLNGGTIEDAAGNGAVLTHDAVAPNAGFLVDGVPPTISAIAITSDPGDDNSYGIGDQVGVTVTFSEDVTVSQNWVRHYLPRLMLNIGGKTKVAKYVVSSSPDPMKFMKFTYTVEDGDSDNNGIAVGTTKLQLLATKVYDTPAKNPADITHQALPDDPGHMVSTPASSTESEEISTTQKSGLLKITGEEGVGEMLTADTSGITDDDGLDHAVFHYWWFSDYVPIDIGLFGAISYPDYEIRPADAGTAIQVKVAFYDDAGNREERVSANAIQVPGCPRGEALPVWSADVSVVEYTSVSIGAVGSDLFSNVCGTSDFRIKSLWSYTPDRDLRLEFTEGVPGAADLTLQVGDLTLEFPAGSSGQSSFTWTDVDPDWEDGQTISVRIVRTSVLVEPTPNNPATGAPTIGGTAQAGETLTADTSGIADEDGLTNATFTYQWLADDANIEGATGSTYTLSDSDEGKAIKVKVSFTDDAGNQETRTSAATAAATAPMIPVTPTIDSLTLDTRDPAVSGPPSYALLTVAWSAPADNGGSVITSYDLRVFPRHIPSNLPDKPAAEWSVLEDIWDSGDLELTLTELVKGVNYEIQVRAVNTSGYGPWSTGARETFASAPGRIEVLPFSDDGAITVTQGKRVDDGGSSLTAYDVRYIRRDAPDKADANWTLLRNLEPNPIWDTLEYTVSGLTNGVWYDLQGRAVNAVGPGPWSETFEQRPAGNPSAPVLDQVTGGDRTLTPGWHRPTSDGGVEIVDYSWCYIRSDASDKLGRNWTCGSYAGFVFGPVIDDAYLTYTITGLTNNVQYDVRLFAHGYYGDRSPASNILSGTPLKTPGAPTISPATGRPSITGTARVGQTLTADTTGIADADGPTNPSFSYQWVVNDGNADADIQDATDLTYKVSDDDVGKTIKVRVSFKDNANNEESLTSEATAVVAATVPGAPEHLTVSPHDTQALDLSWHAPDSNGGSDVTGYKVQWRKTTGSLGTPADVSEEKVTGTTHTINELTEGVEYTVRVVAVNDVGEGQPSSKATGTPRENCPAATRYGHSKRCDPDP